jgi:integrase/recombinase XerC
MDEPALFLSNRERRLSIRQIANIVARWVSDAGIDKDVTPHTLRHSFATLLYRKSGDLLVVQRALGHRNVATTTIYTHLVDEDLAPAFRRNAPCRAAWRKRRGFSQ